MSRTGQSTAGSAMQTRQGKSRRANSEDEAVAIVSVDAVDAQGNQLVDGEVVHPA